MPGKHCLYLTMLLQLLSNIFYTHSQCSKFQWIRETIFPYRCTNNALYSLFSIHYQQNSTSNHSRNIKISNRIAHSQSQSHIFRSSCTLELSFQCLQAKLPFFLRSVFVSNTRAIATVPVQMCAESSTKPRSTLCRRRRPFIRRFIARCRILLDCGMCLTLLDTHN